MGAGFLTRGRRAPAAPPPPAAPGAPPTRRDVVEALRGVDDPEVGLDVVALGLVYDLSVDDGAARVRLTMTTPACPMSHLIVREAASALGALPGVRGVDVALVWAPPWEPAMIDPEARRARFGR